MAEFLVDRSLGRHVVPNAVRAQGHTVHTLWSVYGDAEQDLADTEFLGDAGRHGWAVLTGDMRIRRVAHELAVVEAEGVRGSRCLAATSEVSSRPPGSSTTSQPS